MRFRRTALGLALPLALMSASAWCQVTPGQGKLLLTGGVSSIEGAAGGGLTPWAVTGTQATAGEIGATAFATRALTQDYALNVYGVTVSAWDRVELSLAHQNFDTRSNLAPLSPTFADLRLKQNIVGLKVRVAGDAVLDSDRWMPQIAVGLQHKSLNSGALEGTLESLGAKGSGTDLYVSATKLFLAPGILLNGTLRATKANQNGLLGFGGTDHTSYRLQPEVSAAWLINKRLAVGAEYRAKPDNLNFPTANGNGLKEDDWFDVFIAWAPSKHLSFTLAYVDLGHIAPALVPDRQTGTYLSVQVGF